ncbi:MAG: glutamate 5-kinase [Lachnospiraceae bacterium]|jgi:glutamate 5-kinase|nr:glutamate 5-kinase [Lachnospiraceae bacterium]MCH4030452.1 glutamate 5-kinase [Lachnospiraceae bacterium]MCH4069662.1 glutamate 5-kinase [Lachnospiraceae bacterium]MCH4107400.1 glutamate 5-kinase [Lachnospiraceae bacterium]MCI1301746.1 glutamate 5-kinase [Lachnospiraceae bacterium]
MSESRHRDELKSCRRIVVKIGSSSLVHPQTGRLDLGKIEKLVRTLTDIKNSGRDVLLVSSGAIAVGRSTLGLIQRPDSLEMKQACAAIGQAKLMSVYQKLFAEYSTVAAQVLLTRVNLGLPVTRKNARSTLLELLSIHAIPIINENDSVSTDEIPEVQTFGDNDRLSASVASLIDADLLILLTDIDGMFSTDPKVDSNARLFDEIDVIDSHVLSMGGGNSGSAFGTGGMKSKLEAAKIATENGVNMVIANGNDIDNIRRILNGEHTGTLFPHR